MTIDFKQLEKDKDEIRKALPEDNNSAWDAWDRICMVLEELET